MGKITGTKIIVCMLVVIIMSICITGCKSTKQENVLVGEQVQVLKPAQSGAKDIGAAPSKSDYDIAVNEPDINKAVELCKGLEKQTRKDWCFIEVSDKADTVEVSIDICSNIADETYKADCLMDAASRFKDISACEPIPNARLKSLCTAEGSGNCDMIEDEQDREICLEKSYSI